MAVIGYTATLEISTDGGSTHNAIGKLRNVTFSMNSDTADATNIDSSGWQELEYAIRNSTVSADGIYVNDETGQDAVRDQLDQGNKVDLRFRPEGSGSGNDEFSQTFVVTTFEISLAHDDVIEGNFEFDSDGSPTISNQ